MPTYALSTAKGLTAEQRAKLVESVTSIHSEEANAPRYLAQVIFYKVEPGSLFVSGEVAPLDRIWVRADIRSGQTKEQKARILQRIMWETSEILGILDQSVCVYITDIPPQGVLEFGSILPEPGGEEQWLASLPGALREKLMRSA